MKNVNRTHLRKFTDMMHINGIQFTELYEPLRQAKIYKPTEALTKKQRKVSCRYSIYLSNIY